MPIPLPLTLPLRPPHKNHPLQAKQIFGWFLRWGGPGPPSFSIFCLPESIDKCIYANVDLDLDLDHKSSKLKMLSNGVWGRGLELRNYPKSFMLNSFVISLGKGIGIGIGIWDWYYLIVLDSLNPLLTTVGTFGTFGCILCVVSMQLATVISLGFYPSPPTFPSSTPRRHFRHFSPLASQLFPPPWHAHTHPISNFHALQRFH